MAFWCSITEVIFNARRALEDTVVVRCSGVAFWGSDAIVILLRRDALARGSLIAQVV